MTALENFYITTGVEDDEKIKKISDIKKIANFWEAFQIIKRELHHTDYIETVKELLSTKNKNIPELYKLIWELDVAGILTYNLDDFAEKSHKNVNHQ